MEFDDGAPSDATAALLYDNLDFMHGVEAFINSFPGASVSGMRRGFLGIGVQDNDVLGFPELMDSQSLFLTAQSDTTYFLSFLDFDERPDRRRTARIGPADGDPEWVNDMWFNWVTDMGLPGRDRGAGGRYLIVGLGYDGLRRADQAGAPQRSRSQISARHSVNSHNLGDDPWPRPKLRFQP